MKKWILRTLCPEYRFWTAPNRPKKWKIKMTSQFSDMASSSFFFEIILFLLSSLVTGPSLMPISSLVLKLRQFCLNLSLNLILVWILSDIWRLERVMDTKFCTNVSNKMLLNAAKYQCYSVFELLRETNWRVKLIPPSPHPD